MKEKGKFFSTRKVVVMGMFSALSAILMLFEIPLFFAPSFYKLDFSELPVIIGTLAYGPLSGVVMEIIKILLKLLIKGTSTAFIGEIANFIVGCSFVIPVGLFYWHKKTKKNAIIALILGIFSITVFGTIFNAVYLIPAFAKFYGMPLEAILEMGAKVNPLVKSSTMFNFVSACVAPFNFVKGFAVSLVTLFIYKPLSPILKSRV